MDNINKLDPEYEKIVGDNPNNKFILYLRRHPLDEREKILLNELSKTYGKYKEVPNERLAIFVVIGRKVQEFIDKLNVSKTDLYLSYIQIEDELLNNNK